MSVRELSDAQRAAMMTSWESRGTPCVDALEILEFGTYDRDAKDWVSRRGEYVPVGTLGHFDSWKSARRFMIERGEAT